MVSVRDAMLCVGKTFLRLDVHEHGDNRGEVVDKLIKLQSGALGDPWCSATYAFIYELGHDLAGAKRAYDPGMSTSQIVQRGRLAKKETTKPQCGDAVCFKGDEYGTGYKHTAMFVQWVDKTRKAYWTLEGNIGNAVQMKQHNASVPVTFISCI